jgi:hypothetical protein
MELSNMAATPGHASSAYTTKPNRFLLHNRPAKLLAADKLYANARIYIHRALQLQTKTTIFILLSLL